MELAANQSETRKFAKNDEREKKITFVSKNTKSLLSTMILHSYLGCPLDLDRIALTFGLENN